MAGEGKRKVPAMALCLLVIGGCGASQKSFHFQIKAPSIERIFVMTEKGKEKRIFIVDALKGCVLFRQRVPLKNPVIRYASSEALLIAEIMSTQARFWIFDVGSRKWKKVPSKYEPFLLLESGKILALNSEAVRCEKNLVWLDSRTFREIRRLPLKGFRMRNVRRIFMDKKGNFWIWAIEQNKAIDEIWLLEEQKIQKVLERKECFINVKNRTLFISYPTNGTIEIFSINGRLKWRGIVKVQNLFEEGDFFLLYPLSSVHILCEAYLHCGDKWCQPFVRLLRLSFKTEKKYQEEHKWQGYIVEDVTNEGYFIMRRINEKGKREIFAGNLKNGALRKLFEIQEDRITFSQK